MSRRKRTLLSLRSPQVRAMLARFKAVRDAACSLTRSRLEPHRVLVEQIIEGMGRRPLRIEHPWLKDLLGDGIASRCGRVPGDEVV